jgi:prepilin-type processing-associated H-X9-DG protein
MITLLHRDRAWTGFTGVELLVVIAMIAVFAGVLLPAFAKAKRKSQELGCLDNTGQLMVAWQLYNGDNIDRVVNNFGLDTTLATIGNRTYRNWANNVMSWGTDEAITNLAYLRSGPLANYVGDSVDIYSCPADTYVSATQRLKGWTKRARSVSMNAFFGPYGEPPQAGNPESSGYNRFATGWRQYLKASDVAVPANTYVLLDEHPDWINDGYFLVNPAGSWSSSDLAASYHNGSGGFAFADGHSEMRRWVDAGTKAKITTTGISLPAGMAQAKRDFLWISSRATVRK